MREGNSTLSQTWYPDLAAILSSINPTDFTPVPAGPPIFTDTILESFAIFFGIYPFLGATPFH